MLEREFKVKVIGESSGIWIQQINRKYYRFFDLIQSGNFHKEWWHISNNLTKIQIEIKKENMVFFWLSDKYAGSKDAGIYAMGEVIVDPKKITLSDCELGYKYCTPEFLKKFTDGNLSCLHFQCKLIKEFIDKPILKEYLRDNPTLKDLSVIRAPQPANFRVTQEQWQELKQLYPILSYAA